MPVSACWHDEACTILRLDIQSPWSLPELSAALTQCRSLMSSVEHPVDVIWDASQAHSLPQNMISHFILHSEDAQVPSNQAAVIVIVRTTLLRSFALLAKRALPNVTRNMHVTATLKEAEAIINSLRG
jgi:hypothetical protein